MKKEKIKIGSGEFAKGVEGLVDPIDVGSLHFIQFFNRFLPKFIQKKLVKSSSKKIPFMGFVVEPYCFFLCYEIADLEMAKGLLPDGFGLVKTRIFTDDEPKYYCLFGCFRAHTSAFWGSRCEFYIIAEDKKTGLLSWVIVDYDSDTISYDSKNGLKAPNSKAIVTINHRGTVYVDVARNDKSREISFEANIEKGQMKKLDQRLWLEGNLSVGYGKELSDKNGDVFSLKFEPLEVEKALEISMEELELEANSWFPGLFADKPSKLVCFPYAQHFVSDSPGYASNIKNEKELVKAIEEIDFGKIAVFSTKSFKVMFIAGGIVSFLASFTFFLLWILK